MPPVRPLGEKFWNQRRVLCSDFMDMLRRLISCRIIIIIIIIMSNGVFNFIFLALVFSEILGGP